MATKRRSLAKTMSFRILATIVTVALVYLFTGELALAGGIGALDFVSKLLLYYFHERFWAKVAWGQ